MRFCRLALLVALLGGALAGCEDGVGPDEPLIVSLDSSFTRLFAGDSARFEAVVVLGSGPQAADTVVWTVSDSTVAAIVDEVDGQVVVEWRGVSDRRGRCRAQGQRPGRGGVDNAPTYSRTNALTP